MLIPVAGLLGSSADLATQSIGRGGQVPTALLLCDQTSHDVDALGAA